MLVAGDLGPTGELIEPARRDDADDAQALFEEQLRGLADGGIDVVLIETMSDLGRGRRPRSRRARGAAPDLPIVATLSFDTNLHTMMGVSPAAAVQRAADARCRRGRRQLRARPERDGA